MRQDLHNALERLNRLESMDALSSGVLGLKELLEVDHVVFHAVNHSGDQYVSATYSQEWQEHYRAEDLTRIDPVVKASRTAIRPVNWNQLDWSSRAARGFLSDATDAGVGSQGLSVPARGPQGQFAILTVSHTADPDAWDRRVEAMTEDLQYLTQFINGKALELYGPREEPALPSLSPRESEALVQLALGKSRPQAADALGISEHTLRVYIESARLKLGAKNTIHAVAKGLSLGLVAI